MLSWPFFSQGQRRGQRRPEVVTGSSRTSPVGAKKKAESELLISGAQEQENLDLIKRVPRTAHEPNASLRGSASRVRSLGTEKVPHSKTIGWQTCVGSPKNHEVGQSSRAHRRQLTFCTGQPRLRPPQHPALLTPGATVPTRCCCPSQGGQRVCRIQNGGARTHSRFTPAPWEVREDKVAGHPCVQSA